MRGGKNCDKVAPEFMAYIVRIIRGCGVVTLSDMSDMVTSMAGAGGNERDVSA